MAQPVWVLSVDLQTKTATFQSGMAEAARSARGAFTEIKSGSAAMGREVSVNMFESRHAIMATAEAFGVTVPRALTAFATSMGPVAAALEAAFPFAAIVLGATLLIEHLQKMHEESEKLTRDQTAFGTAVNESFNSLNTKILQAEIRADELRNDHLGALKHQLELIDQQSMGELVKSLETVAKAADEVFKDLNGKWYVFGSGASHASDKLKDFQSQYDNLVSAGKTQEASDYLKTTLAQQKAVLEAQQAAAGMEGHSGGAGASGEASRRLALRNALNVLQKEGTSYTEIEIAAQQRLVEVLTAQQGHEEKIAELKKLESGNATRQTGNELAGQAAAAAKAAAESRQRVSESGLAGDKAAAEAQLTIQRASVEARLASELDFANRKLQIELGANAQEIAALDKSGKDYTNQLKALQEKAVELTAQHGAQVAELTARASVEANQRDLQNLESNERQKIEATEQGSAARLAAINAAIKEEEARTLQDTAFYRDLQQQRVQVMRQMQDESNKLAAEAGKEAAENTEKMGELSIAALKEQQALEDSARRTTDQQRLQQMTLVANQEYAIKMAAFDQQIAALDKYAKDYQNKLKELQDRELQLTKQHENELTAIKDKAEEDRNTRILSAEQRFNDTIAAGLTQVIMGHKTFAQMMLSIGDQVVSGMIENAIKSILADDMTKEHDAAAAARKAYLAGMNFPFPVNIVMGPVLGAAAFASVMAFETGGIVPGVGRGDVTPAMLTPGEAVLPKSLTEGLTKAASSGSMGHGQHVHIHGVNFSPTIHALDADGVDEVLTKHQHTFEKHFNNAIRRMNK